MLISHITGLLSQSALHSFMYSKNFLASAQVYRSCKYWQPARDVGWCNTVTAGDLACLGDGDITRRQTMQVLAMPSQRSFAKSPAAGRSFLRHRWRSGVLARCINHLNKTEAAPPQLSRPAPPQLPMSAKCQASCGHLRRTLNDILTNLLRED